MYYIDKEELEDFIKYSHEQSKQHGPIITLAAIIVLIYLLPLLAVYTFIYVVANLPKKLRKKVKEINEKNN